MGDLVIHAGDASSVVKSSFTAGSFYLGNSDKAFNFFDKTDQVPATDLVFLQQASEEAVKTVGGTVGWGAVGGTLLGPVGLLAGLLLGGKKVKVTFVAKFKDGRKIIATTDQKTWVKIQAAGIHLL